MARTAEVDVWYLAMASAGELVAVPRSDASVAVEHDPALNRSLYHEIGADHHWVDLREHDEDWWRSRLRDRVTLVARVEGEVAGYAELAPKPDGSVDLAYFGIRRAYQGRGIGGHLLSEAIAYAWGEAGAQRVTVDTCALDGPGALPNYRRRGFSLVRTARERRGLSD